jgi:hypothetical protein
MIITLWLYICTSAALDDCQAYAEQQYTGRRGQFECLRDIEPTMDAARADGHPFVVATCNVEHNQ